MLVSEHELDCTMEEEKEVAKVICKDLSSFLQSSLNVYLPYNTTISQYVCMLGRKGVLYVLLLVGMT